MKLFLFQKNKLQRAIQITIALLLVACFFCLPQTLFDVSYSTVVNDRNGELLGARIAEDEQWRFPPSDTVPQKFKICVVEFEDRYFRYHWGVNPLAIGRAVSQNIEAKRVVSGGSTISMQVIRLSRNKKRTVWEKCVEIIFATRLEFRYSKEKILALYASHAPFGGNVVGLNAASWRYFRHSAEYLSWAEAATLAILPNAPAMLHISKNRDALLDKRNRLLKRLFEKKIIDETNYHLSLSENLPHEPLPLPQIAPHLVNYFYKTNKGEQCLSTIDKNLQLRVEDLLDRWHREFVQNDIKNMAAIVIDVATNQVLAYCGNVNFNDKNSGNQVDVVRAERSSGSILKPFLYCAMLAEGELLPKTLIPDIPININGFVPQNFNLQFEGAVPASEAVIRSLNVPLVQMLRTYSVPKFYDFLKDNKVASLPRSASNYGLSLILGGAEVSLMDVSTAYSNMARTLLELEATHSCVLLNQEPKPIKSTFNQGAVWQVFDAIKEVNRPEEIDWRSISTMQKVAWKTGTSYGFRDAWAVGVTPRFVVGVWVGNASGEGKPNLIGARTAGPVMFDIFDILPASKWFEVPYKNFIEAEVCRESGHLKGRFCENTDTVLILPKGQQTTPCPHHQQILLTADERFRVYENCTGEYDIVRRNWFVLPPVWSWYYKQHHPDYKSLPPFKSGCGQGSQRPMQFIYPQPNAIVHLPKQMDGSKGKITFELAHNKRNAIVFWHVNNEYISSTTDFHTLSIHLLEGQYYITVVDDEGNTLSNTINIYD